MIFCLWQRAGEYERGDHTHVTSNGLEFFNCGPGTIILLLGLCHKPASWRMAGCSFYGPVRTLLSHYLEFFILFIYYLLFIILSLWIHCCCSFSYTALQENYMKFFLTKNLWRSFILSPWKSMPFLFFSNHSWAFSVGGGVLAQWPPWATKGKSFSNSLRGLWIFTKESDRLRIDFHEE